MKQQSETNEKAKRNGIQSVEIGLRILHVLASMSGPSALGAIAKKANMSASQTHRYLQSLISCSMVAQNPQSGLYDLGSGALQLGLSALMKMDSYNVANEALTHLSKQTGWTFLLSALGPNGAVVVRMIMGYPPVHSSIMVGSYLPLLRSATGNVFLGFREATETRDLIAAEITGKGGITSVEVDQLRQTIRQHGYASMDEAIIPSLRAIAVPIFDAHQQALFVATIIMNTVFVGHVDEMLAQLLQASHEITRNIGGAIPADLQISNL